MSYQLQDFKRFLVESYRPGTVYEYMWRVKLFTDWLGGTPIEKVDQTLIINYMHYLKEKVTQPTTYAYALKCYFEFLGRNDLSGKVPVQRINVQKIPLWLPEPAIKVLVSGIKDTRSKAMACLMYDLALRTNEALMLNYGVVKEDKPYVDLESGVANVMRLKTKQYPFSILNLSKWATDQTANFAAMWAISEGSPMFSSKPYRAWLKGGGRMSTSEAVYLWRRERKRFNLPDDFTLHCFRHSKLTWMAVMGESIIDISKFAGHSSTSPTLIYTHIAQQFHNHPELYLKPFKDSTLYAGMIKATNGWYNSWLTKQAGTDTK